MEPAINSANKPAHRKVSALMLSVPVLGLVGMGISGYLTYLHYQSKSAICLPTMNCEDVLTSPYSQMWGIPLSLLGLLLYAAVTVLGLGAVLLKEKQGLLVLGTYGFALSGMFFILYLYYLEIFEIHAFCTWCVASSIVMAALLVVSIINLRSFQPKIKDKSRPRRFKLSRYIRW